MGFFQCLAYVALAKRVHADQDVEKKRVATYAAGLACT